MYVCMYVYVFNKNIKSLSVDNAAQPPTSQRTFLTTDMFEDMASVFP